jgi:hypothetical protein
VEQLKEHLGKTVQMPDDFFAAAEEKEAEAPEPPKIPQLIGQGFPVSFWGFWRSCR